MEKFNLQKEIIYNYIQLVKLSNYKYCNEKKTDDELFKLYEKLELHLWTFEEYSQKFLLNDKLFPYRYVIPRLIDVLLVEHFFNDIKINTKVLTKVLLCIEEIMNEYIVFE